eukprot:6189453-Pleurochrysis_carterae.AAC.6
MVCAIALIFGGVRLTHFGNLSASREDTIVALTQRARRPEPLQGRVLRNTDTAVSHRGAKAQEPEQRSAEPEQMPAKPTGCLITKWSAVWLVGPDGARSHIAHPTDDCTLRATEVGDELDKYPKAHGGEGKYQLGTTASAEACA